MCEAPPLESIMKKSQISFFFMGPLKQWLNKNDFFFQSTKGILSVDLADCVQGYTCYYYFLNSIVNFHDKYMTRIVKLCPASIQYTKYCSRLRHSCFQWQKQKQPSQSGSWQFETRKCNACAVVQLPQVLMCLYYTSLNDPLCWATSINPFFRRQQHMDLSACCRHKPHVYQTAVEMSKTVTCSCWWIRGPLGAYHLVNSQSVRFYMIMGFHCCHGHRSKPAEWCVSMEAAVTRQGCWVGMRK